jgi:hypothetical protein
MQEGNQHDIKSRIQTSQESRGKSRKQNKKHTFKTPRKETEKETNTVGQITCNEDKKSSDTYDARE